MWFPIPTFINIHSSFHLANYSKTLHVTKFFPVPPPACNNTNFCVEVSSISTKIPNCSSFNLFSLSKWKTIFHWSSVNPSLLSMKIAFKLFYCSSVKWYNCIVSMRNWNCFFVNIAWIMLSNILYVSSMHIKIDTPLQCPIWISFGPFGPGWDVVFSIIVSSKSSGFNLWISDHIVDNEKPLSSRLFVDWIFCCLKIGDLATFS